MANKMKSKQANNQPWQNRIVEYCEMSPAELPENPNNWRTHPEKQRKALAGALGEIGLVQSVVFNRRTGRLVDGHLRVAMAREAGQEKIPVVVVDLSENEEAVILATIDPLAALAGVDAEKLDGLLRETKTCSADLQELLADLLKKIPDFNDDISVEDNEAAHSQRTFVFELSQDEGAYVDAVFAKLKRNNRGKGDGDLFLAALQIAENHL